MASHSQLTATTSVRRALNEEATLSRRGYTIGVQVGEGSYAQVYSCYDERRKRKCAMKIVNRRKAPSDFLQKFLPRELQLLRKIQHPYIIQLYEIFEFGSKVYISMELAGHGDLLDYIKLRRYLTEPTARTFFQQLILGIEHLHHHSIVHRDLKCENLLLMNNNSIKITDFGFARETAKDDLISTFCGSAAYAAPEVLQGQAYKGEKYDVWSMGVILYIMVCGTMPFDDSNIKKMIRDQLNRRILFSRKRTFSEDFKECIFAILHPDPEKRLTVAQMCRNVWIKEIHVHDEKCQPECPEINPNIIYVNRMRTVNYVTNNDGTYGGDAPNQQRYSRTGPRTDAEEETHAATRRRPAEDEVKNDETTTGESSNKQPRLACKS